MQKKSVTYKLVKNGRAVYIGVTDDPYRRNLQHSQSGKNYDHLVVTSNLCLGMRSNGGRLGTSSLVEDERVRLQLTVRDWSRFDGIKEVES